MEMIIEIMEIMEIKALFLITYRKKSHETYLII